MTPEMKSGAITGVIGTLSAILSGLALYWVAKPHEESGKLLYFSQAHEESDSYDKKPDDTVYVQTFKIYNTGNELKSLDIMIPLTSQVPSDLVTKVTQMGAVITKISDNSDITKSNSYVITVANVKEYGTIEISFRTKNIHKIFDSERVVSPNEKVIFFRPDEAWQYVD